MMHVGMRAGFHSHRILGLGILRHRARPTSISVNSEFGKNPSIPITSSSSIIVSPECATSVALVRYLSSAPYASTPTHLHQPSKMATTYLTSKHLPFVRRSIIPRGLFDEQTLRAAFATTATDAAATAGTEEQESNVMDFTGDDLLPPTPDIPIPDHKNVQGDIYTIFPKVRA